MDGALCRLDRRFARDGKKLFLAGIPASARLGIAFLWSGTVEGVNVAGVAESGAIVLDGNPYSPMARTRCLQFDTALGNLFVEGVRDKLSNESPRLAISLVGRETVAIDFESL
jgi:hypothetical protein